MPDSPLTAAIEAFLAALTQDEFDELVHRTRPLQEQK